MKPTVDTVAAVRASERAEIPVASHSVPVQCGPASFWCPLAITPKTLPTAIPARPTLAVTTPSTRCVEPGDDGVGTGGAGGTGDPGAGGAGTGGLVSSASGGTSLAAFAAGPCTTARDS